MQNPEDQLPQAQKRIMEPSESLELGKEITQEFNAEELAKQATEQISNFYTSKLWKKWETAKQDEKLGKMSLEDKEEVRQEVLDKLASLRDKVSNTDQKTVKAYALIVTELEKGAGHV